jgi:molecular chaperone GrpE
VSAGKKNDPGKTGNNNDFDDQQAAERLTESDERVYDITADEGSSLESALKELEEHVDAIEAKKRKGKKDREKAAPPAEPDDTVPLGEYDKLQRDFSDLSQETASLKDKWLRSVAEFENFRKRSRKEWELLKMQSRADVILEILTVVDDFERAFAVAENRDDEFVQGIRLIYQNLQQALGKFDVRPIDALNTRFDPNFHMAIGQIESDTAESDHVVEETQKGYLIGDTVLRPAKVIIAK